MSGQNFELHANDPGRATVVANLHAFTDRLPADRSFVVSFAPLTKKRTEKQRRALFGAAYRALMEFAGLAGSEDKRELHRFMCRKYFGERSDKLGRMVPLRTTTTNERGEKDEIDTQEALRFYEFLQREGASVGCYVPDPDPFWREQARRAA